MALIPSTRNVDQPTWRVTRPAPHALGFVTMAQHGRRAERSAPCCRLGRYRHRARFVHFLQGWQKMSEIFHVLLELLMKPWCSTTSDSILVGPEMASRSSWSDRISPWCNHFTRSATLVALCYCIQTLHRPRAETRPPSSVRRFSLILQPRPSKCAKIWISCLFCPRRRPLGHAVSQGVPQISASLLFFPALHMTPGSADAGPRRL